MLLNQTTASSWSGARHRSVKKIDTCSPSGPSFPELRARYPRVAISRLRRGMAWCKPLKAASQLNMAKQRHQLAGTQRSGCPRLDAGEGAPGRRGKQTGKKRGDLGKLTSIHDPSPTAPGKEPSSSKWPRLFAGIRRHGVSCVGRDGRWPECAYRTRRVRRHIAGRCRASGSISQGAGSRKAYGSERVSVTPTRTLKTACRRSKKGVS